MSTAGGRRNTEVIQAVCWNEHYFDTLSKTFSRCLACCCACQSAAFVERSDPSLQLDSLIPLSLEQSVNFLGIASPVTVPIISQRRSVTISRWGWCLTLVSLGFYYMRLFYWSSLLLSKILDRVSVHWIHVPHHHFCYPPT